MRILGTTDWRRRLTGEGPAYRWVMLALWIVSGTTGFVVLSSVGVLLPSITTELSLSPSQQGLLGSAPFWGTLGLTIPLAWWASRFGPKRLTSVTLALGVLCVWLQAAAPVLIVLLIGRVLYGVSLIVREPARALLTQQWFNQREYIVVGGISHLLFGFILGGGWLLTPFLLRIFDENWRTVLYSYSMVLVVLTVLWMLVGRERVTQEYREREASQDTNILLGALRYRDLWISSLGSMGITFCLSAFTTFYPTLMLERYDVSLQLSGAVVALSIVVGGFAGLGVGFTVTKVDIRRPLLVVFSLLLTGSYLGMVSTGSATLLMVSGLLNGISWGFWPIVATVPFQLPGIRPREVAVGLAFSVSLMSLAFVLGPIVAGLLQEVLGDLRPALMVVSLGCLSLIGTGIFLRFRTLTDAQESEGPGDWRPDTWEQQTPAV